MTLHSTPARRLLLLAFWLLGPAAPALAQDPPAPDSARLGVGEARVEVVDRSGKVPRDLTAADLSLTEDGVERPLLAVELPGPAPAGSAAPDVPQPAGGPWRVTVYFDAELAGETSVSRAARALAEQAAALAALGWVEVVTADPDPRLALPATRSVSELASAFDRLFLLGQGRDRLVEGRRAARAAVVAAAATGSGAERDAALAAATAAEVALVQERLDTLLAYAADSAPAGPRALLWVGDGFDLDPAAALRERLVAAPEGSAWPAPGDAALAGPTAAVAQALAAVGVTVVPVSLRAGVGADPTRWGMTARQDTPGGDTAVLGTYRLKRDRSAAEETQERVAREAAEGAEAGPEPVPDDPLAALAVLAEATGGEVVTDPKSLAETIIRLAGRVRLRWGAERPPGAEPAALAVAARRPGLTVRGGRWVGGSTPEAVSALRARRLLAGEDEGGDYEVVAAVALPGDSQTRAEARLELAATAGDGAPGGEAPVAVPSGMTRVTLAVAFAGGETVIHRRAGAAPTPSADGFRVALPVPVSGTPERVAVVVEDLATGLWGGALAGIVGGTVSPEPVPVGAGESIADTGALRDLWDVERGLLPAPKVVNLVQPPGRLLRGPVRIETVVGDPAVVRVEFRLDGRPVAVAERAPFAATIEVGDLPLRRRLEVVASRADGRVIGRDSIVLNEGGRAFGVRITEPLAERRVGPVDVAAEVVHPAEDRIEKVEVFWNDRLVATLFQPPWRARLVVPAEAPSGFIRVAARLAGGATAEDVRFLNGGGPGSRVDVNLVELYVVVADGSGRPVRGLAATDFRVAEGGQQRELAEFSDAGDLPVTVGLAIDSSASMFVKLETVREAAAAFLKSLAPGRDAAFLVDFDSQPRLAAETTGDLERVAAAVAGLRSGGKTSLWEAMVYSLVQLQGVRGRKALVVYSDGADEDPEFSYRTALRFARKVGVPVYVIVSNNEAVRTAGLGLRTFGDRVERLTAAVGGKTYLVRSGDDLGEIYADIAADLRSQYLLTFYTDRPPVEGAVRDVEVEVRKRGLTARTVSGVQE